MEYSERAQTLVEALPYIQKFRGRAVVVKYGGNAMVSRELFDAVMEDIILLNLVGISVILVHGGGPEINDMLQKLGKEPKFINGLRYTDQETMDVVQSVLCGKVNKALVAAIGRKGGRAVGLCGLDGGLFEAKKLDKRDGCDYGLVGEIVHVDPTLVNHALKEGIIPVVATVAYGGEDGAAYNVNADTAAAKLAAAVGAEKLILLTDTTGVLSDPKDPATRIPVVLAENVGAMEASGVVSGGMIPKLECCAAAVRDGVKRTHVLDGRVPHVILMEMLTDAGVGTMVL